MIADPGNGYADFICLIGRKHLLPPFGIKRNRTIVSSVNQQVESLSMVHQGFCCVMLIKLFERNGHKSLPHFFRHSGSYEKNLFIEVN